jgi:hypothetical protein
VVHHEKISSLPEAAAAVVGLAAAVGGAVVGAGVAAGAHAATMTAVNVNAKTNKAIFLFISSSPLEN